jgi:hypothetical protein
VSPPVITPSICPEVLAALARLNAKDFAASCAGFAEMMHVTPKGLHGAVLQAQADLQNVLPYQVRLPSEEPVVVGERLCAVAAFIKRFIVLTDEQADAIALWAAYTYTWETAEHAPLLIINAPRRACGKTMLQDIVLSLSNRAMGTANTSASALFRIVEIHRPTVFVDEADTFLAKNEDMQGLINSGHRRGKPLWRTEKVGNELVPKAFDVFCPKCIAGIALERHLAEATMSRGIVINMRRRLPAERVERWSRVHADAAESLTRGLAWIGLHKREEIECADPQLPEALSDRDQDNWRPLFAIAQCAGPDWAERAKQAALKISANRTDVESISDDLLKDLRDILEAHDAKLRATPNANKSLRYIATEDLLEALIQCEDSDWARYSRGEQLTSKQLAKLLAPYGLRPKTVRIREGMTPKGYEIAMLREVITRYAQDGEPDALQSAATVEVPQEPSEQPDRPSQNESAY